MPKHADGDPTPSLLTQYERALRIDKNALDDAWIEQPDVFYRVAAQLALVTSQRDAAKLTRDNAIAELDKQLREANASTGVKTTEKGIENEITTMPRVITIRESYAQLCYQVDQWAALVEAFRQRSYALKELTNLYAINYYATETGRASGYQDAANHRADIARAESGRIRREKPMRPRV